MATNNTMIFLESGLTATDLRAVFLKAELDKKYNAFEKNCIVIDANIKEAKDDLAYLKAERLRGYTMTEESQTESIKKLLDSFIDYINKKLPQFKSTDKKRYLGEYLGEKLLPFYVLKLESSFSRLDCRNDIEYKRLVESGKILTEQSAKSEQNVNKINKMEQYIYIGAGALVLLVGLYVISKKE